MTDPLRPVVRKLVETERKLSRQIAVFGAVSVGTTLLDFGIFNLFVFLDLLPVVIANTISYSAGIAASYLLNKKMTFAGGGRDKRHHEVGLFVLINIGGLLMNNLAVGLAAGIAGGSVLILNAAKLVAGVFVWVLKFVTFSRWVYPMPPAEVEPEKEPG